MKLDRLMDELKAAGFATLYFLCCFLFVMVLKKLFLAQYDIAFYGLSTAAVGAAIVGKVMVVLDKTGAGTRFESSHPPGVSVFYKTLVYSLVVLLVIAAEKVFHAYRESHALGSAVARCGTVENEAKSWLLCSASGWPSGATTFFRRSTDVWQTESSPLGSGESRQNKSQEKTR